MPRHKRLDWVDLGQIRAARSGAPSRFSDLYYFTMELAWPAFVGLVCLVFLLINVIFGAIYAAMPGAIANAGRGSLIDGMFFSVDTLGTVGYGRMYPATHAAHLVAAVEILLGLFFSATVTGLIFARYARPRVALAFSRRAVIGRWEGRPALMVRMASLRSRPLADADAQLSWLETVRREDGSPLRRMTQVALVRDHNPMLGLAWTLVHPLPDDGALLRALDGDDRFMITVTVRGVDTLLASATVDSWWYGREDVRRDHEFVDILSTREGALMLDFDLLHETRPLGGAAAE